MIRITEKCYKYFADKVYNYADGHDFIQNMTYNYEGNNAYAIFELSAIIYKDRVGDVTDILPVWYTLRTITDEGERPNDFNWSDFKTYLL